MYVHINEKQFRVIAVSCISAIFIERLFGSLSPVTLYILSILNTLGLSFKDLVDFISQYFNLEEVSVAQSTEMEF